MRLGEIAEQNDLVHLYDAVYVAVSEQNGAAFWTADESLVNSLRRTKTKIKLLQRDME
ncbi:hypothetical protein [Paenibacillus hamazuiensis]|uniref:hypothetical protein n=1 Tax=Paenibacillus hamazuiensis TaxID=2936508 RepID=UPI002010BF46|nr:hypothetical protein [Paenibacillus hamazuiensis]